MAQAPTPGGTDALRSRLEFEAEGHELTDLDTIVATIKAGEVDGPARWNAILHALRERAKALAAGIVWQCTLPDLQVTEEDMTLKEARVAQRVSGRSWLTLDPVNDADSTVAVLTALFHTRLGLTLADAAERAEAMPQLEVAEAFTQYTVNRPFDQAPTPPSPSASTNGDGRPRSPKRRRSATSAES